MGVLSPPSAKSQSQNISVWKGIKLNHTTRNIIQTLLGLWQTRYYDHFPWKACFSDLTTLSVKVFLYCPKWTHPDEVSFHFLMPYCWSPETGDISSCRAAPQPLIPLFLHITRITLSQVENLALALLQVTQLVTPSSLVYPQLSTPKRGFLLI